MKKPNRQNDPSDNPSLWLVATPIGNLGDVSERMRQILGEAKTVLCEDTRHTRELFSALQIPAPRLERADQAAEVSQAQNWVERAKNGEVFVYVSDAGTPGISDPGALLVDAFHQAGLEVRSIPGPSSAILAVALSGFSGAFSFLGFLPRQDSWQEWKENLRTQTQGGVQLFVGFESPKRILTSLEKIRLAWGDESHQLKLFIGKELTKKFEKHWRGNLDEVIEALREEQDQVGALGEWVWAIQWVVVRPIVPPSEWERALKVLIYAGVSVSESAKLISKEWDISRHVAYEKALQFKDV